MYFLRPEEVKLDSIVKIDYSEQKHMLKTVDNIAANDDDITVITFRRCSTADEPDQRLECDPVKKEWTYFSRGEKFPAEVRIFQK